jgi:hypothetical protein
VIATVPVESMIRSQTATPARSPSAASSSARLAFSSLAASPEQGTVRLLASQISIFDITPVDEPLSTVNCLTFDPTPMRQ